MRNIAPTSLNDNKSGKPQVGSAPGGKAPLLPEISNPKGGGAIRATSEKFAANPATGAGGMRIPIAVSPGRGGFAPDLTLSYQSSMGNGPFGFGWDMGLPRITRKTGKGVPRYRHGKDSDVFILSGTEDLVPWLDTAGCRQTEESTDGRFVIERFLPRVEGLFARIERWTEREGGDVHWRSISRGNVVSIYGDAPGSRVSDSDNPTRVFAWLISQSYDDKGNAMVFDYVEEDLAGVTPGVGPEWQHPKGGQIYPKRVRYGNRVSRLIDSDLSKAKWLFEVVFDYGEGHVTQTDAASGFETVTATPMPRQPWQLRPDCFSDARSGIDLRTRRRCQRVLMYHNFEELGDTPCLVRSTEFDFADQPEHFASVEDELAHDGSTGFGSFLMQVTEAGYERTESGHYRKSEIPPTSFAYNKAKICDWVRSIDDESLENLPAGISDGLRWVDLDGEGLPGLLARHEDAWHFKPNFGDGRFGPSRILSSQPRIAANPGAERFMDLSGDGRLDLVELDGPAPGFYERDGAGGWESFRPLKQLPHVDWDAPSTRLVDLTGDGLADVLVTRRSGFDIWRALGEDGFAAPETVYNEWDRADGPQILADGPGSAVLLSDMSGDGLPDVVNRTGFAGGSNT